MKEIIKQADLIYNGTWDILCILDACPHRILKEVYSGIFGNTGKIQKIFSPASWTLGWLLETFEGRPMEDVVFISGTPAVSSKGIYSEKIHAFSKRLKYSGYSFDAREHFKKIIDVWDFGYDKKLGQIHPDNITNETIKAVKENPECRFINKYYQVHDPYLYYINKGEIKVMDTEDIFTRDRAIFEWSNIRQFVGKFLSDEAFWTIRKNLGFPPTDGLGELWLKYGRDGIIKGYLEDLIMALNSIKKIVDNFPDKKIVISADHGERIGENGRYGHQSIDRSPPITDIPWLEIGGKST